MTVLTHTKSFTKKVNAEEMWLNEVWEIGSCPLILLYSINHLLKRSKQQDALRKYTKYIKYIKIALGFFLFN